MKTFLIVVCIILFIITGVESLYILRHTKNTKKIPIIETLKPTPLNAYTFENLKKTVFPKTDITLGSIINQTPDHISQKFYFSIPETPTSKTMKKVSGVMNIPNTAGNYPVIVMFRGYVPEDAYEPGIGTQPVAQMLASKGFITLAPDFLGFAESDKPSSDAFESRFQTYTTALGLFPSLETLNASLDTQYAGTMSADLTKIGIWGHSNGGHIALSTLEISGADYPTVLWAPVSTSFPYSILYYTNESDDQGKTLRSILSDFENTYDTAKFSPTNYYSWIKARIQIDQGQNDHEVPIWWSDDLVDKLKKENIEVTYNTYPQADHNLLPDGWSKAVENTITFYQEQFLNK
jgi:dipeptidyl aminopeptidase/acylaminoacyl peptidase